MGGSTAAVHTGCAYMNGRRCRGRWVRVGDTSSVYVCAREEMGCMRVNVCWGWLGCGSAGETLVNEVVWRVCEEGLGLDNDSGEHGSSDDGAGRHGHAARRRLGSGARAGCAGRRLGTADEAGGGAREGDCRLLKRHMLARGGRRMCLFNSLESQWCLQLLGL